MNRISTFVLLMAMSGLTFAGGANSSHSMSSHKAHSKGVHFYGKIFIGYEEKSTGAAATSDSLRDNGGNSRIGLKFREPMGSMTLVGGMEYTFDIADGMSTEDATTCDRNNTDAGKNDCQTFELHTGNMGLETPLGYIGFGTFESPYKTFGMYDTTMDTAVALNQHGGFSKGTFGISSTWGGVLSYHAAMGPIEFAYMYGLSEQTNASVQKRDYSYALKLKDLFLPGLEIGIATSHDNIDSGNSNNGSTNDKVFASYKVMPGLGVFMTNEDTEITDTFATNGDGKIQTFGAHYKAGNTMWQIAKTEGDSAGADTEDYDTVAIAAETALSKSSSILFGYARQGYEDSGNAVRTWTIGMTHGF